MARTTKKTTSRTPRRQSRKTTRTSQSTKSANSSNNRKSAEINKKAQWAAYKELQAKVDRAWDRLQSDVKRKANPHALQQDKNELLLLLGECNYMARECMRMSKKKP